MICTNTNNQADSEAIETMEYAETIKTAEKQYIPKPLEHAFSSGLGISLYDANLHGGLMFNMP